MKLDDARKSQLTAVLDALFTEENARLAAPIRFAKRHVKNVMLRTRKREGNIDSESTQN